LKWQGVVLGGKLRVNGRGILVPVYGPGNTGGTMINEKSQARLMLDPPPQLLDLGKTPDRLAGDAFTIELRIEAAGRKSIAG